MLPIRQVLDTLAGREVVSCRRRWVRVFTNKQALRASVFFDEERGSRVAAFVDGWQLRFLASELPGRQRVRHARAALRAALRWARGNGVRVLRTQGHWERSVERLMDLAYINENRIQYRQDPIGLRRALRRCCWCRRRRKKHKHGAFAICVQATPEQVAELRRRMLAVLYAGS